MLRLARPLAIVTAIAFAISMAFPITAALARDTASFPRVWGVLDVTVAFVMAILVLALMVLIGDRTTKRVMEQTYRAYRLLTHAILVGIVAFFLFGDRITWSAGLLGVAWRTWLLLYALPSWYSALSADG